MEIQEFDALYKRLAPLVFRRAYMRLKDEDEARDCVQSAFLSLWEQRGTVSNPAAFVNTAVTNAINTHYRTLSSRERFSRLYPIEMDTTDEEPISSGELIAFVDSQLSEAVGRVVRCVFFMKLTYRQTSELLGISESTVNKHVVTALRQMRRHFKRAN